MLDHLNDKPDWLEDRTILLVKTGSHAYGTATANSDQDFRGICIPPKEYFTGLKSFENFQTKSSKNFKNTKDDVDITIQSLSKFVRNAYIGTPNEIEMLHSHLSDYERLDDIGRVLLLNKDMFLTKNLFPKFTGFAHSRMSRAVHSQKDDLYDTKAMSHAIRLVMSTRQIFGTGKFTTHRPDDEADLILKVKRGEFSFEEASEIFVEICEDAGKKKKKSDLPEKPNYNAVNGLLMGLHEAGLNS